MRMLLSLNLNLAWSIGDPCKSTEYFFATVGEQFFYPNPRERCAIALKTG